MSGSGVGIRRSLPQPRCRDRGSGSGDPSYSRVVGIGKSLLQPRCRDRGSESGDPSHSIKSYMHTTSRVALFRGVGQPFEISRQPIAASSKDDALVQVLLATICGSDLHTVTGRRSVSLPCALGHETVGVIAAPTQLRDAYGSSLKEGDRVTWSIGASCGRCYNCIEKNLPQKCEGLFKYGHAGGANAPFSGGFAEYIQLRPGTAIYRLPAALTEREAAPLNCALATVLDGLKTVGVNAGECAVVQGAGMLGIYAACYLRENGCQSVIVVDYRADRLRMADRFGATHTFNLADTAEDDVGQAIQAITNGNGADLAVEVSGAGATLSNALEWLGFGGRCLTLGFVLSKSECHAGRSQNCDEMFDNPRASQLPSIPGSAKRFGSWRKNVIAIRLTRWSARPTRWERLMPHSSGQNRAI